ncbi:MAG: hypothetical protein FJ095_07765 [Deltaproteobacteria bacterium]|nr:hypothetical protein [Deltaproteobacteria bacterium]
MTSSKCFALLLSLVGLAAVSSTGASCGDSTNDTKLTSSSTAVASSSGAGGEGGQGGTGSGTFAGGQGGAGVGGSCADTVVEANVTKKPVDIIFVVDVSGSMSEEIAAIEQNINLNFAQIIGQSGVDYRIIMLVDHGPGTYELCVEAPLSTIPKGGCGAIGASPPGNNPGKFYQYSMKSLPQSNDSLCLVLDSLYGTKKDDFNLAPNGWNEWLRPEAAKIFLFISDDRPNCTWSGGDAPIKFDDQNNDASAKQMALAFDKALLALSPQQFGTSAARNYQFYGLVGLQSKNLAKDVQTSAPIGPNSMALDPFQPFDGVTADKCKTAVSAAMGYQYLAKGTGGLRFPVCELGGFDAIFKKVAEGVVSGSKVPCKIALPEPEDGQALDLNTITLVYSPGDMSVPDEFTRVESEGACAGGDDKFYIDEAEKLILLCPETCKRLEADPTAKVEVKLECGGMAN